jgi:hypothetical protein
MTSLIIAVNGYHTTMRCPKHFTRNEVGVKDLDGTEGHVAAWCAAE